MNTHFTQWIVGVVLLVAMCGCTQESSGPADSKSGDAMSQLSIVFLTRDGCVNTPVMRANLDTAMSSIAGGASYEVVDQGSLVEIDPRRGYPTPTILLNDRDLFGIPEPSPPFPSPS